MVHSGCYCFLMPLFTAELCGIGTGLGGKAGPVGAKRREYLPLQSAPMI